MTRITRSSVGVMALLLLPCVPVSADDQQTDQPRSMTAGPSNSAPRPPWVARVFVSANGGWQLSSIGFSDSWHTTEFVEDASWTADYDVKGDLQYDGGVMVRVWKNAGIGASFSEYRNTNGALITGQVPHPFLFERLRELSGESVGLKHEERALHISASYLLPMSRSIDLTVFGGPSIFSVTRSFVDAVTFTQSYPFDSVAFSGTNVETAKETQVGFHVGADVAWYFTRNVGVGGIARFTRASVDFATAGGDAMKIDAGGFQLGAGLRFRFGGSRSQGSERRRHPSAARPGPSAVEAVPVSPTPGPAPKGSQVAIVLEGGAPVFVGPAVQRSPLDVLPAGARLAVSGEENGWVRVEWNDRRWGRRVGFVQSDAVRLITDAQ